MLDELAERDPAGGVHVQVVLVCDVLLVDIVRFDSVCPEAMRKREAVSAMSEGSIRDATR